MSKEIEEKIGQLIGEASMTYKTEAGTHYIALGKPVKWRVLDQSPDATPSSQNKEEGL